MDLDQRTSLLYHIISDYHRINIQDKQYIIQKPTHNIVHRSWLKYQEVIKRNKYNGWLSDQECIEHLIKIGKWTIDGDQKIEEIKKTIDKQKVELYKSYLSYGLTKKTQQIHQILDRTKKLLFNLCEARNALSFFTLKSFAAIVSQYYVLENTVYYNDELISFLSSGLFYQITAQLNKLTISSSQFRELARTDPWRAYCGISDNPFNKSIIELDQDKRTLLTYSKMYDNIHENPDCPDDVVLNDDDMLDGWMLVQKEEKEERKKEISKDKNVSMLSPKYQNANEIFLPANSVEQVQTINEMNSPKAKAVKQQRQQIINQQGQVGAGKLPDEYLLIQQKSNEMYKESVKQK